MYACSCMYVRTWERARVCTTADPEVLGHINKHSNWTDLWMILYLHIVTSLMNIQIKIYENILNGMRVTAHFSQWPLAVRRTPQRHF